MLRVLLKTMVMPPAINFLLILLAACLWRFYPRLARGCLALSIVSLWLLSTPWVASQLIMPLEQAFPPILADAACPVADAIVVLGGGLNRHSPEYSHGETVSTATLSRIRYGAVLARRCGLGLAVSSGKTNPDQTKSEAEAMAAALEDEFKVRVRWIEDESRNTAENATFTVALLRHAEIDTIILVTNAYHMPRSVESFRRQGIAVIAAPTGFVGSPGGGILDWLPSSGALWASNAALHEYLGSFVYRFVY